MRGADSCSRSGEQSQALHPHLGLDLRQIRGEGEIAAATEEVRREGARGDLQIDPRPGPNHLRHRLETRGDLHINPRPGPIVSAIASRSQNIETNQCLRSNGGCWQDEHLNVTACRDTFRGRVCECPTVNGVQYQGNGYTSCQTVGPGRCAMNNGGCWSETRDGQTFSACTDLEFNGCKCPAGFYGDGYKCEDLNECTEKLACNCPECSCKNEWGGYECKCKGDLLYIKGQDTCIAKNASGLGWFLTVLVLACLAGAGIAGYIFYKYRLRSYMDSEIMAIMSQYMPLDNQQNETQPLRVETEA